MVYLVNILVIPLYYLLIRSIWADRKRADNAFVWVASIHAILFRALANPYNYVDTENYAEAYIILGEGSLVDALLSLRYIDWGQLYVALNWILYQINNNPLFLFFILSILAVGGVMFFYAKTSYAFLAPILIYLSHPMMYFSGFGVIRQHLSIVFTIFALYYIKEQKKSITLAFMGVLFHTSGIIFFPYYLWRKLNFRDKGTFKMHLYVFFAFIVARALLGYVLSLSFFERNSDFSEAGNNNLFPVVLIGGLVYLFIICKSYRSLQGRNYEIALFMSYGLVIGLFSMGMAEGGRLTLPFLYVLPAASSLLLLSSKNGRFFYKVYIFFVLMLIAFQVYRQLDYYSIHPYTFLWQDAKAKF